MEAGKKGGKASAEARRKSYVNCVRCSRGGTPVYSDKAKNMMEQIESVGGYDK